MIKRKNDDEVALMKQGGKILAEVLWEVMDNIKPGVSEIELDALAEDLIKKRGGESGFKRVKGYHHTICVSTNDVVVHGIPTVSTFVEGDVVGIDCGVYYKGFNTDMADTKYVGDVNKNSKIDAFLKNGKKALEEAIKVAKAGNRVGQISKAIQNIVEGEGGYSIVRSLVGHGVGKDLHEEPEVPGYLRGSIGHTPLLVPGMVIAIEIIYNMGNKEIMIDDDGWTIRTRDNSLSGLYERTVAITDGEPIVLTS